MSSGLTVERHVNNRSGREISAVDYLNHEYILRIVEALRSGEGNPALADIISDILVLQAQSTVFDNKITDLQNRFPKPEDFGVVFDAYYDEASKTLEPGCTDNTLAMNVYHLACRSAGVEPTYPRLPSTRGVFCSGLISYYGPGKYSGVRVFAPVSGAPSAQVPLGADRISADRKTVTFYNQPPGKTHTLFINGTSTGVTTLSDVAGTVSFSYPAGIPNGASIAYTSATVRTWAIEPDAADVSDIPVEEVKKWNGGIKGGSRLYGLFGRKGQCITLDTGEQFLLGRGGIRTSPTVTVGNPATFTIPNSAPSNTQVALTEDSISADRKTVTVTGQPANRNYALFINGIKTDVTAVSNVAGVVSLSYPAGIPAGATVSYSTENGHGIPNNRILTMVAFDPGSLPTGFTEKTFYYAVNVTKYTYQLALTPGGVPLAATTAGSNVQTSSPDPFRAGDVFQVDSDEGDVSPAILLDYEMEVPANRVFNATISKGNPAVFTKVAHTLVNDDVVRCLTNVELPAPIIREKFYYVVNATADTFNISTTRGGSPVVTTSDGSGTHKIQAPLIAWNSGSFRAEIMRDRIEVDPHPVVLIGPTVSPRETIWFVGRSNTTVRRAHVYGIKEGLTPQLGNVARCVNFIAEECHLYDGGASNTQYGINFGLVGNWTVNKSYFRGVRRCLDSHRSKAGNASDNVFPCGIGGHFLQNLNVRGGTIGADTRANPQLLQYTGGDLSFYSVQMMMKHPALTLFNMRPDYCSLGGTLLFSGNTIIIDLNSYADDEEIQILDLAGPVTINDTLVDIEWPQTVVVDSSNTIIVRGKKLNRKIYLFRIARNFTQIMQRRAKPPLYVEFNATWQIEDQSVRDDYFLEAGYTNINQFDGPGPEIKIGNVPEIFFTALAATGGSSRVDGRANVSIDCPRGRIRTQLFAGGFRSATLRGSLANMNNNIDRTYPQGDEGVTIIDADTGLMVDTVHNVGGADNNNWMTCPRDKQILRVNGASSTVFNNVRIVFPRKPSVGQTFTLQTSNPMNANDYNGDGLDVVGSPPSNLLENQSVKFVVSRNRAGVLEWVYEKQV